MAVLDRIRISVAALVLFSAAAVAQGEASPDPVAERSQQFFRLWSEGAYLAAIAAIEEGWETLPELRSTYVQRRPALDGFVVMTEDQRRPLPPADPAELARYEGATVSDAIAEIVERAKSTRLVIVNETHDNPRDRAFVLAVARALRPLGYSVYAAESLDNSGTDERRAERLQGLVEDGYPRRSTGTYLSDPTFGTLIRGVLELGYRPQSYEFSPKDWPAYTQLSREEQIDRREQEQAENLARAIAAAGPDAKVLIHVGYSHAAERPVGPEGQKQEWMAARLARLTGIDPLTVDQTGLGEYSYRALHAALAQRIAGRPVVFLAGGRSVAWGANGDATDLQVVHPRIETIGGRPDWLQRTGREAVAIPAELLPRTGRRLIQAFAEGEAADTIPVDQVLVRAGETPPVIYIPAGMAIRWAVQDPG